MRFKIYRKLTAYVPVNTIRAVLNFLDYYVVQLFKNIEKNHVFLYAAGIAYSLLLSVIPIMLLSFSLLDNFIGAAAIETQISQLIDAIIPYPEYAEYTKHQILDRIPQVIEYKTIAAVLGGLGLFFTSTWLFSNMRTVLNKIFVVTEEKSEWIGLLRDFGMVVLLILFILLATFIIPIMKLLINAADTIEFLSIFKLSGFSGFLFSLTSLLVIFIMFYIFYYIIPYEKLGKKVPAVAALWATIFWEIARNLFGYYISNFLSTNRVYGAFVLMIVVIFWLFYSSILFVLGAQIGQMYRERLELKLASDSYAPPLKRLIKKLKNLKHI